MTPLLRGGALALFIGSFLASTTAGQVFEKLRGIPEGWKLQGPAADGQLLKLQIGLQQGDVAGFEKALMEMSTPSHPKYGQHFKSHEEVKRMLLPSKQAIDSVLQWLQDAGVVDIEEDADWLNFRTNVSTANKLMDTKFQWYVSEDKKSRLLRTLEYSIPKSVSKHVNLIQPTTRFGQVHQNHWTAERYEPGNANNAKFAAAAALNESDCNSVTRPECLKSLYQIDYTPDPNSGSKVAFVSYLEQYARYSDLELFEQNILPSAIGQNFSVVSFNGGLNNQTSDDDSGEANLDLEYMLGVSSPLPITEFTVGGRGPWVADLDQPTAEDNYNEPYLAFFQNVLKLPQEELPQVISTSYGENEQSVPKSYALSVCNLIAQLGARGVSVLYSSGDSGTGSACLSNDGRNITKFQPQYPASCPWVTSVGGTQYLDEEAVFFSSGGFSDYWERPLYQELAVGSYLRKLGDKWKGYFNPRGRGFPDVAAQSVAYSVYDKGRLVHYRGTSCSTPAFGGIVGLLNDARLRAGLPPLGFLNPLIYTVGQGAFNDIAKGGSTGCDGQARFHGAPNGSPVIPYASWNATEGWDPVTGLGTPIFPKLLKLAVPFRYIN